MSISLELPHGFSKDLRVELYITLPKMNMKNYYYQRMKL